MPVVFPKFLFCTFMQNGDVIVAQSVKAVGTEIYNGLIILVGTCHSNIASGNRGSYRFFILC